MDHKLELVIFDMDGLMFDTERISYDSWMLAAEKYGYNISKELFNQTIGRNMEMTKELYYGHFGQNFPMEEIINERAKISDEIISRDGVPIKRGLFELLDALKALEIKMAVATSTSRKRAVPLLSQSKAIGYFDCVVCGDEVEESKPNPEIFLKACDFLSCNPENTLVLEDSEAGIEAAYKAGMMPIMIPDIKLPNDITKTRLHKLYEDLTQVIDFIRE